MGLRYSSHICNDFISPCKRSSLIFVLDEYDDVDENNEEQIEKLIDYNCVSEIDRRVFDKDGCFLDVY